MAGDRDAGVDPRFDPVFQRGYDPDRHRTRVRPPAPVEPVEREPVVTTAPPPAAPRGEPEAPPAESAPPEEEYLPPRRNPFRLALLLGSLAAIAGSVVVLWRRIAQDPYGGYGGYGGDVGQVFYQQFSDALFAPLLTGGLLGLILWIAIGALRSRGHD